MTGNPAQDNGLFSGYRGRYQGEHRSEPASTALWSTARIATTMSFIAGMMTLTVGSWYTLAGAAAIADMMAP